MKYLFGTKIIAYFIKSVILWLKALIMIMGILLIDFTYVQEHENGVVFFENWAYSQRQSRMLISAQDHNVLVNKVHILNTQVLMYKC